MDCSWISNEWRDHIIGFERTKEEADQDRCRDLESWLRLLLALMFVLRRVDAGRCARRPAAQTAQIWTALAIVVMFAGWAAIFAYELVAAAAPRGAFAAVQERRGAAAGPSSRLFRTSGPPRPRRLVTFAAAGVMMLLATIAGCGRDRLARFIAAPPRDRLGVAITGARSCGAGWAFRLSASTPPAFYDSRDRTDHRMGDSSHHCRTSMGRHDRIRARRPGAHRPLGPAQGRLRA